MIFFFGTISVLQLLLLPGLIIVNKINNNSTFLYKSILVIFSSIITNYFLVTLLILFKIYTQEMLITIIIIEIMIITKILYKKKYLFLVHNKNILQIFFILFSIGLVFLAAYKNTGNVFYGWDALISFNEWARQFSSVGYYTGMIRPDLVPKIWSLTYVLIDNNNIQYFAKFTTVIFPILIILMNLDDILTNNKLSDYIKFILYLSFFYFHRNFILMGYVDIPLLTFVAYFFYNIQKIKINLDNKLIASVTILSACAIKISAIFLLPILFWRLKKNYIYFISTLIFSLIYIIFIYKNIWLDLSFASLGSVFNETGTVSNFNLKSNIKNTYYLFNRDNILYLFILSSMSAIFLQKARVTFLLFVVPGFIYWSMFLSYDTRNILFVIPALIITGSMLLEKAFIKLSIIKKIINNNFLYNIKFINKSFSQLQLFYILILLSLFSITVNNEQLINKHMKKTMEMLGGGEVNKIIANKIKYNEITKDNFVTDFQKLFFVPGIKETLNFNNSYYSDPNMNLEKKDYYLIYGHAPGLRKSAKLKINNKQMKILFKDKSFLFVGKN